MQANTVAERKLKSALRTSAWPGLAGPLSYTRNRLLMEAFGATQCAFRMIRIFEEEHAARLEAEADCDEQEVQTGMVAEELDKAKKELSHACAIKAENDGLKAVVAAYEPTPAVLMNMDTATLNNNMSRIKQSMDMYTAELGARAAAANGPSCAICYSSGITSIGGLPCGHTYCWSCCDRLVRDGADCPHCREPINKPPMRLFGLVPAAGVQAAVDNDMA